MNQRSLTIVAIAAGLIALSHSSLAQTGKHAHSSDADTSSQARTLYRKGVMAYETGHSAEARQIFLDAWALQPSADVALELAQTEVDLKMYREAAEHLDYAIRNFPPSINEKLRDTAKQALADTKSHVGQIHLSGAPDGADIFLDGKVQGKASLDTTLYVEPGTHTVEARSLGYYATKSVKLEAGKELMVDLTPDKGPSRSVPTTVNRPAAPATAITSASPMPREQTGERSIIPVIVGGAVFAVGVATAIGFKLDETAKNNDAKTARQTVGTNGCRASFAHPNECLAMRDAAEGSDRDRKIEIAGLVLAGAAATATALYWFWPRATPKAGAGSSSITIQGGIGSSASFVGIHGEF